jgi:hypothetical protein
MKKFFLMAGILLLSQLRLTAQVPTKVLIEVFTGASCEFCPRANEHVDSLVADFPQKVIAVKYQSMPPGYDPMYIDDSADVHQRQTYYVPAYFPDGSMNGKMIYPNDITIGMIDSIYAISSSFTLTLNHSFSPGWDTLHVRLIIRANAAMDFTSGKLKARFAITEDSIWFFAPPGSNTEKTFYKVCKKMIPDAMGVELPGHWVENQLDSVIMDFPMIRYMSNLNNLSIAAFLQNDVNKSVLQAVLDSAQKLPDYALIDPLHSLQLAPVQCFDSLMDGQIVFMNAGTNPLTFCLPAYSVDGGPYNSYEWSGNLAPGQTTYLMIPPTELGNGMHNINIRVTNPNGAGLVSSRLASYNNSISVQKTTIQPPMHEYFANPGFPYPGWAVYNQSKNGNTWKWLRMKMDTTSFMLSALQLRWFIMNPGTVNEVFLPAFNVTQKSSLMLSFDMVYASFGELSHDTLKVMASTDCGQSWDTVFSGQGLEISTTTMDQFEWNYALPDSTEWVNHQIDLTGFIGSEKLLLKIRAISNSGNDMYIRNVFVGPDLGVQAVTSSELRVYPNPMYGTGNLEFMQDIPADVDLRILDIRGQLVKLTRARVSAGLMHLSFDVSGLDPGVYILEVNSARDTWRKKILVSGE